MTMHLRRLFLAAVVLLTGIEFQPQREQDDGRPAPLFLRVALTMGESAHAAPMPERTGQAADAAAPVRLRLDPALRQAVRVSAEAAVPDKAQPATGVRLDLLQTSRDLGKAGDVFGATSWQPPPPPPPPPPVVVEGPPQAPPLPFRFVGQVNDGLGNTTYFLMRGTETLSAVVGQNLAGQYLLERAENGVLHFTYLPLRQQQILQIGSGA